MGLCSMDALTNLVRNLLRRIARAVRRAHLRLRIRQLQLLLDSPELRLYGDALTHAIVNARLAALRLELFFLMNRQP